MLYYSSKDSINNGFRQRVRRGGREGDFVGSRAPFLKLSSAIGAY